MKFGFVATATGDDDSRVGGFEPVPPPGGFVSCCLSGCAVGSLAVDSLLLDLLRNRIKANATAPARTTTMIIKGKYRFIEFVFEVRSVMTKS